jgi:hypothetical protein
LSPPDRCRFSGQKNAATLRHVNNTVMYAARHFFAIWKNLPFKAIFFQILVSKTGVDILVKKMPQSYDMSMTPSCTRVDIFSNLEKTCLIRAKIPDFSCQDRCRYSGQKNAATLRHVNDTDLYAGRHFFEIWKNLPYKVKNSRFFMLRQWSVLGQEKCRSPTTCQ